MKWLYRAYQTIVVALLVTIAAVSVSPATVMRVPVIGPWLLGTVFSSIYDTATPLGTDAPSTLDDQIRLTKAANQERNNVDHIWDKDGTQVSDSHTGEHRKVLFHAPIAATPTVAANHGDLRIKDVSGKAELAWTDEDQQELIVTDAGTLNIVSADLIGTLANNTFFTAVDQAGTGTVDLIEADANDVAVVPDNSQTATNAAPTSTTGIANKKYVDDNATRLVQAVNTNTGSYIVLSTAFPVDNTIPQITEGTEVMTRAITPASAGNKLKITVVVNFSVDGASTFGVALFQDSTANALIACASHSYAVTVPHQVGFVHYMSAGTTSSTTFKVRAGNASGTAQANGNISGTLFGGLMISSITIEEIVP